MKTTTYYYTLETFCCDCFTKMGEKKVENKPIGVSHGICQVCYDKYIDEKRKKNTEQGEVSYDKD